MAKGDVQQSPWRWFARDNDGLQIWVDVYFNNSTRVLTNTGPGSRCAILHRDSGCAYTELIFEPPGLGTSPRLAAPADGQPDRTFTVNQIRSASNTIPGFPNGWQTIEDVINTSNITAD
jgi:hypothetical protein